MYKQHGFGILGVILALLVVSIIGFVGWYFWDRSQQDENEKNDSPGVSSFEECVAAGYPVMESFPEQCSDGENTFVNDAVSVPDIDSTLQ